LDSCRRARSPQRTSDRFLGVLTPDFDEPAHRTPDPSRAFSGRLQITGDAHRASAHSLAGRFASKQGQSRRVPGRLRCWRHCRRRGQVLDRRSPLRPGGVVTERGGQSSSGPRHGPTPFRRLGTLAARCSGARKVGVIQGARHWDPGSEIPRTRGRQSQADSRSARVSSPPWPSRSALRRACGIGWVSTRDAELREGELRAGDLVRGVEALVHVEGVTQGGFRRRPSVRVAR